MCREGTSREKRLQRDASVTVEQTGFPTHETKTNRKVLPLFVFTGLRRHLIDDTRLIRAAHQHDDVLEGGLKNGKWVRTNGT